MYNTIILVKGEAFLSKREYKKFEKGDTICGGNSIPKELMRWSIEHEQEAREELSKYVCVYHQNIETWSIEEYALEYCKCNEYGEFIEGSDYDFAKEEEK